MMIKNIKYDGFEVINSSFTNNRIESEGGYITLESEVTGENERPISIEDKQLNFYIDVDLMMRGCDKDDEDVTVFSCSTSIVLKFILHNKDSLSHPNLDDLIAENLWYFNTFIELASKEALKGTLRSTRFEALKIPNVTSSEDSSDK